MHIKYTKINYTLNIVLRKDFSLEKFTVTGKLFHNNTLSKEIATNTGSTPGFR